MVHPRRTRSPCSSPSRPHSSSLSERRYHCPVTSRIQVNISSCTLPLPSRLLVSRPPSPSASVGVGDDNEAGGGGRTDGDKREIVEYKTSNSFLEILIIILIIAIPDDNDDSQRPTCWHGNAASPS